MGAPYVSIKRLVDNSLAAMLAAVEVYNKPQMTYRDEVTVMLIVNAWELAFKATLRQKNRSIFYPKQRGERYRSIGLDDALGRVAANKLWPSGIDGPAVTANVKALAEYRDRAIHLYNAQGLGGVIYPFLQQNVLNYRDFMLAKFKKDLAESMTWQLLPLGATAPADAVQFMKVDKNATMVAEVQEFIDELRQLMDDVEAAGSDMARVATVLRHQHAVGEEVDQRRPRSRRVADRRWPGRRAQDRPEPDAPIQHDRDAEQGEREAPGTEVNDIRLPGSLLEGVAA